MRRLAALIGAAAIAAALSFPVQAGMGNCGHTGRCAPTLRPTASPTARPTPTPTLAPTALPSSTPAPTPTASPAFLFDDEFNGGTLAWGHNYHCCMNGGGLDPSLSWVGGGYLHLDVVNRSGVWYGTIVDTKSSFTHTYGYYEARISIPRGTGLWPAFWLYLDGYNEIDQMEICANPVGANGGNDVTGLHTTVHYGSGLQLGATHHYGDLSLDWHVYAVDWRPDHLSFYLDGVLAWTESTHLISTSMAILLDLGLGGSWCGSPTTATPLSSEMLVDWVHVRP